jgi:hypothetical protein
MRCASIDILAMDKNKKKKAADGTRKGEKRLSDYKSREAEGKSGAETQFQKAFGTSKDAPRKG